MNRSDPNLDLCVAAIDSFVGSGDSIFAGRPMRRFKVLCMFVYRTKTGRCFDNYASLMIKVSCLEEVRHVFRRVLLDEIALGKWQIWGEPYEWKLKGYLPEPNSAEDMRVLN